MKKIVFSFDDGLIDFYHIIFPILQKYKIKATLNVATGLVDGSFDDGFDYCSINQIKEMEEYGVEMAIHSDRHKEPTTSEDFAISLEKLSKWIGRENIYGAVIPYNIPPNKEIYAWMNKNRIKYLRSGDVFKVNFIHKVLFRLHKLSKKQHHVNCNSRYYKKGKCIFIPSFPIFLDKDVEYYKTIINMAPKNGIITLMFHSIFSTKDECLKAAYPEGAWTVEKFEDLIKWIFKNNFEICTQKETICR